jgi:hypothetical protein
MQVIKKLKNHKNKYLAYIALAITIFVVTPLDDIVISSIFGGALFGFGTFEFYFFTILTSAASILIWITRGRKLYSKKKEEQHETKTNIHVGFDQS